MPEILEAEAARALIEDQALGREIVKVHAPDSWIIKRGATPRAMRAALRGDRFVTARRRGKFMMLDTASGPVLGVHLGMSGRILIDGLAAGDPLVYASNRDVQQWRRFGVSFADGGSLWLRDPRRLGAVELDPDEDRLGPDALTLTKRELDAALGSSRAPLKARLMDQHRIAGLGNLLVDEVLFRAGLEPTRPAGALDDDERRTLRRAIRTTLRILGRRGGSHTGDLVRHLDVPCPRCGGALMRAVVGGRTTYWCPSHQH